MVPLGGIPKRDLQAAGLHGPLSGADPQAAGESDALSWGVLR